MIRIGGMATKDTTEYADFVDRLVKPGSEIIATLTPEKMEMLHYAVGLAGEAGELLDAVKKHVIYNKPLDIGNVNEEMGDAGFFLQALRNLLGFSREEIENYNRLKLSKRYSSGTYSDQQAQNRADKTS